MRSGTGCQAPGTRYQEPHTGTWHLVSGTWVEVRGAWDHTLARQIEKTNVCDQMTRGGIVVQASGRRHQGEGMSWHHWRGSLEESSRRRHHGGGIIGEASWRRHHGGGIHLRFSPLAKQFSRLILKSVLLIFIDLGWLWDSILVPLGSLLIPWEDPWDHPGAL